MADDNSSYSAEARIAQSDAQPDAETAQRQGVAQRRKRGYSKTGLTSLRSRVKVRGLGALDKRMAGAKALLAWRGELLADLGGKDAASAAQLALIDTVCRDKLYLDTLDGYLLELGDIVNRRKRTAHPVLLQRMQIADAMTRRLVALGLERRKPQPLSLSTYLAAKARQTRQDGSGSASAPADGRMIGVPIQRALRATRRGRLARSSRCRVVVGGAQTSATSA